MIVFPTQRRENESDAMYYNIIQVPCLSYYRTFYGRFCLFSFVRHGEFIIELLSSSSHHRKVRRGEARQGTGVVVMVAIRGHLEQRRCRMPRVTPFRGLRQTSECVHGQCSLFGSKTVFPLNRNTTPVTLCSEAFIGHFIGKPSEYRKFVFQQLQKR